MAHLLLGTTIIYLCVVIWVDVDATTRVVVCRRDDQSPVHLFAVHAAHLLPVHQLLSTQPTCARDRTKDKFAVEKFALHIQARSRAY